MSAKNTLSKFVILDSDDDVVVSELTTDAEALKEADEFINDNLDDNTEDGESFELGIYKLVKVISATRKVTRTVTSVK